MSVTPGVDAADLELVKTGAMTPAIAPRPTCEEIPDQEKERA